MFERYDQPVISSRRFTMRVAKALLIVLAIDGTAILLGAIGYRYWGGLSWISACSDAVLVITGNGLVAPVQNEAGRIFSMFDALIGVLVFITGAGMVLGPIFHRILHTFHLESQDNSAQK